MVLLEYAVLPASEAFTAAWTPFSTLLSESDLPHNPLIGQGHEHPDKAYSFVFWNDADQQKQFETNPEFVKLRDGLKAVLSGPPNIIHISMEVVDFRQFERPVLEVFTLTTKENEKDELKALLSSPEYGKILKCWGQAVESPEIFVVFVGYGSIEEHETARRNMDPVRREGLKKVAELAKSEMFHVKFTN